MSMNRCRTSFRRVVEINGHDDGQNEPDCTEWDRLGFGRLREKLQPGPDAPLPIGLFLPTNIRNARLDPDHHLIYGWYSVGQHEVVCSICAASVNKNKPYAPHTETQ